MNIFKRSYSVENVDINEIDDELFYTSLLYSIGGIKKECKRIDKLVHSVANRVYIPTGSLMDHYDAIIELAYMKRRLIELYKAFVGWYKTQTTEDQKLCVAYFIKKDIALSNRIFNMSARSLYRYIPKLVRSFRTYIKLTTNLDMELIKYPLIYSRYIHYQDKKYKHNDKRRFNGKKKEVNEYDDSTNERCHSSCL